MADENAFNELPEDPVEHFKRRQVIASSTAREAWKNANENESFCRAADQPDHQWPKDDYEARTGNQLPTLQINDTILAVNAISGREIVGSFEPTYVGQDEGSLDQGFANVCRQFARKVRELGDFEHVDSDRFRNLHIQNYSWNEWMQDLSYDPIGVGQTRISPVELYEMTWDPKCGLTNLEDRVWDARGRWVGYEEAMGMFPLEEERREIAALQDAGDSAWVDSDGFAGGWPYGDGEGGMPWIWKQARAIFVVDYNWRVQETHYLVDMQPPGPPDLSAPPPDGGRYQEIETADELNSIAKTFKKVYGQELPWNPLPRWRYNYAFIVGDKAVRTGETPIQRFTRQCMTGFPWRQQSGITHYSTVDLMKDGQRFQNLIFSMAISMFQNSAKQNFMVEELALSSPEQAENWSKIGGIVKFREGKLKTGWAESSPPAWPPAFEAMLQHAADAVWRPIGMNPSTLGQMSDLRRVSGTVMQTVQENVETVLSYPFAALRMYRKESARLMLDFMEAYYDEETVAKMVGGIPSWEAEQMDPAELEQSGLMVIPPKSEWGNLRIFDILVDEASRSQSQMHDTFKMWVEQGLANQMIQQQLMPADILPDMAPGLPEPLRARWKNYLRQMQMQAAEGGEETGEPTQ